MGGAMADECAVGAVAHVRLARKHRFHAAELGLHHDVLRVVQTDAVERRWNDRRQPRDTGERTALAGSAIFAEGRAVDGFDDLVLDDSAGGCSVVFESCPAHVFTSLGRGALECVVDLPGAPAGVRILEVHPVPCG